MKEYTVFLIDHNAIQCGVDGAFGSLVTTLADNAEQAGSLAKFEYTAVPENHVFGNPPDLTVAAVIAGHHGFLYADAVNG